MPMLSMSDLLAASLLEPSTMLLVTMDYQYVMVHTSHDNDRDERLCGDMRAGACIYTTTYCTIYYAVSSK